MKFGIVLSELVDSIPEPIINSDELIFMFGFQPDWVEGDGMVLSDIALHSVYKENGICTCGRYFKDKQLWKNHYDEEVARDILINHARNSAGECFVCGKIDEPLSSHVLYMFAQAGLQVIRINDQDASP